MVTGRLRQLRDSGWLAATEDGRLVASPGMRSVVESLAAVYREAAERQWSGMPEAVETAGSVARRLADAVPTDHVVAAVHGRLPA